MASEKMTVKCEPKLHDNRLLRAILEEPGRQRNHGSRNLDTNLLTVVRADAGYAVEDRNCIQIWPELEELIPERPFLQIINAKE